METVEPKPTTELVHFLKDGAQFGYDVRPGFYAKVYAVDLDYLAAVGVIDWKARKPVLSKRSAIVINNRKKKR